MQHTTLHITAVWSPFRNKWYVHISKQWYQLPTAWIYSIQFEFWYSWLHYSACHLNNKTYPLTPDLHWHHLHLCNLYWIQATSTNKWLHHFGHATLYTTTLLVYPLVTTSTLCWITTNTSTTDTFCFSFWRSPLIITLVLFCSYLLSCLYSPHYSFTH